MGRTLKRVPMDFDAPLREVWEGYLMPDRLIEPQCPDCKSGYSRRGQEWMDRWYGNASFDPADTGSVPFTTDTPAVRDLVRRHIDQAPEYYGTDERAVAREARRLARLFNSRWCHHLDQDDVNALVEADRLHDFTHTWSREDRWQPIDPPVIPSAAEVNEWSLRGFGHDGLNANIAVRARCEREGVTAICSTCDGHGTVEAYEGQRAEAEAWEWTEPPEGEGYQLWETTSEGSPVSPVFATIEELCEYAAVNCSTFGSSTASAEGWRKMLDDDFVAATSIMEDGSTAIFL